MRRSGWYAVSYVSSKVSLLNGPTEYQGSKVGTTPILATMVDSQFRCASTISGSNASCAISASTAASFGSNSRSFVLLLSVLAYIQGSAIRYWPPPGGRPVSGTLLKYANHW